jgi:hypothetical protein
MTITNALKGLGIGALSVTFMYYVMKSYYEPTFPDAVIQYKSSTTTPQYSGFDLDGNGDIDKINVYRAYWLGYQNKNLVPGDQEFENIKNLLEEELTKKEETNCFTGENRIFPINYGLEKKTDNKK